ARPRRAYPGRAADGPDLRRAPPARAQRADPSGLRLLRDPRGLRLAGAGDPRRLGVRRVLPRAPGPERCAGVDRPRQAQRQRLLAGRGPPLRRHRRTDRGHPGQAAGGEGLGPRPDLHLRRRRTGRHHDPGALNRLFAQLATGPAPSHPRRRRARLCRQTATSGARHIDGVGCGPISPLVIGDTAGYSNFIEQRWRRSAMTLTVEPGPVAQTEADTADAAYNERLRLLSEGSVHKNFDPFGDIDWESPEFAVVPNDRRWILQRESDPLGAHPWYQAQDEQTQIEIGMWRQANVAKVGLQFENILIRG